MYSSSGCFFNIKMGNGVIKCRSYLDIYQNDINIDLLDPEAFIVMMNPGNSKPLFTKNPNELKIIPEYHINSPNLLYSLRNTLLIQAKPDTTQYQIMRLMKHFGWKYVRILNLSDIRNTKSKEFVREYKKLNNTIHSIFLGKREKERNALCKGIDKKPVIVAWGVHPELKELAVAALEKLPSHIKGLQGNKEYLYYHPLPRGKRTAKDWLDEFIKQIHFI